MSKEYSDTTMEREVSDLRSKVLDLLVEKRSSKISTFPENWVTLIVEHAIKKGKWEKAKSLISYLSKKKADQFAERIELGAKISQVKDKGSDQREDLEILTIRADYLEKEAEEKQKATFESFEDNYDEFLMSDHSDCEEAESDVSEDESINKE